MTQRRLRTDALPEDHTYRDDGCDVSPLCTSCPLPVCRYEVIGGLRSILNRSRDKRIRQMRPEVPAGDIATQLGVSLRTVYRVTA